MKKNEVREGNRATILNKVVRRTSLSRHLPTKL